MVRISNFNFNNNTNPLMYSDHTNTLHRLILEGGNINLETSNDYHYILLCYELYYVTGTVGQDKNLYYLTGLSGFSGGYNIEYDGIS
jgi:hypothetical protein